MSAHVVDMWAEIDLLERDPVAQDALLRDALLSQPDVPASVRILAALARRPFHGAHPGETA